MQTDPIDLDQIRAQLGRSQSCTLSIVRKHPGRTSVEMARLASLVNPRVLNRRLPELERLGLVVRGEIRECQVSGWRSATWEAA